MKSAEGIGPMKAGDSASQSLAVSAGMVEAFGELVGDRNPIHLDDAFAKTTRQDATVVLKGEGLVAYALGRFHESNV